MVVFSGIIGRPPSPAGQDPMKTTMEMEVVVVAWW